MAAQREISDWFSGDQGSQLAATDDLQWTLGNF